MPKPLRDDDIGTWKCEASSSSFGLVGTFIDVGKKSSTYYRQVILYSKNSKNS